MRAGLRNKNFPDIFIKFNFDYNIYKRKEKLFPAEQISIYLWVSQNQKISHLSFRNRVLNNLF